jgi:hypothetical protein
MAFPDNTEPKDWFPFYDGIKLTAQWYAYYFFEHIGIIILSYIIVTEARTFRKEAAAFFWIQVASLADYVLTYNTTWFHVGMIPISMNVLAVGIFGVLVYNSRDGGL